MPDTILSDLQRIQNTAARILTKCGDLNCTSVVLLKKVHWLPVRQRITRNLHFDIQGIPQNCSTVRIRIRIRIFLFRLITIFKIYT